MKTMSFLLISVFLAVGARSYADDATARTELANALALYAQRADLTKVDAAIAAADEALAQVQDAGLKYNLLVFEASALYFKAGQLTAKTDKLAGYVAAEGKATAAKAVNANYAEAYYWYAAALGMWGDTMGKDNPAALVHLGDLLNNLSKLSTATTLTSDGKSGEAYEYYGADRIYGRIYSELPPSFHGSHDKAITYLQKAYTNGKLDSLNVLYYADELAKGTADEIQTARNILDELLRNDPNTYNPDRIPESIEEFNDCKTLRAQLG